MNTQGTQGNQETPHPVPSEIARLIQQWDAEAEATQRALTSYAITARHDFINKRMQSFCDEKDIDMMTLEAKKMQLKAHTSFNENSVRGENEKIALAESTNHEEEERETNNIEY
jgi:hypothetical protein